MSSFVAIAVAGGLLRPHPVCAVRSIVTDNPIRAADRLRCVFVTVLWGPWHRQTYLEANLPTMLAPGNLPALAAGIDCEYLLYTTAKDALVMIRDPAFKRLRTLVTVSINLFSPRKTTNPIGLHHEIWRAATERARERRAYILLMPPDVVWADGSFASLRAALDAGKRMTFMTYPRVVSETVVPAMADHFPRGADHAIAVPPAQMMALAVTHIHPLMAAYARSATHFPFHPEMVLWPIEGDGYLLRLLARELFCFEAGRYQLNAQSLLAQMPPQNEIHVFRDSREFLGLSLTPLWKDMEWYLRRATLDPLLAGRWWITYDSPINDYLSAIDLRFTSCGGDAAQWRRVSRRADNLMAHLRFAREFTRVLLVLRQMGHYRAAEFLAAAMRVHGIARRFPHRGPFVILAPTDAAFELDGYHLALDARMSAADARRMIEAHAAAMPTPELIKDGLELTTLAGRRLYIEDADLAQQCGANIIIPLRKPRGLAKVGRPNAASVQPP